jgi:2-polyprenyl-6-methoxyphenol hydroxylase-like FAD-dependent oxidoreductase
MGVLALAVSDGLAKRYSSAAQDGMVAVSRVAIVGSGHAGGTVAALLRQHGHTGLVTMVGAERLPPYQRPPLSKAWLKGEVDADVLALKNLEFYAEYGIDFRQGTMAVGLVRADADDILTGQAHDGNLAYSLAAQGETGNDDGRTAG